MRGFDQLPFGRGDCLFASTFDWTTSFSRGRNEECRVTAERSGLFEYVNSRTARSAGVIQR